MMEKRIAEIIATCEKYGFMERTVQPYSFVMTVRELVEPWRDYSHYTKSSQGLMRAEIRGFEEILKSWVAYAEEPTIRIHFLQGNYAGQTRDEKKSLAEIFIQTQMAELA